MESKLSIFKELWQYAKIRKRWWIAPLIVFLVLIGFLVIFAETSALAPIIYTLF